MNKLVIKLKQHTPLIHFQHNQEGATLRASEVKPKLDKFILTQLGKEQYKEISDDEYEEIASNYEKDNPGCIFDDLYDIDIDAQYEAIGNFLALKYKWIKGKGLDYKMRIEMAPGSTTEEYLLASSIRDDKVQNLNNNGINTISGTPFFAQERENSQIANAQGYERTEKWNAIGKKGIIIKEEIEVSILIMKDSNEVPLTDYLKEHIQSFFLSTNFGTRQSKGFGSFTVTSILYNDQTYELKNNEDLLKQYFQFVYKKATGGTNRINIIFTTINNDYRLIKSGQRRPYKRSRMMLYADERGMGWDKKYIKKAYKSLPNNLFILKDEHPQDYYGEHEDYKYYRAMLGLTEQFEFLLSNPPAINSKMIVKVSHPSIKRFQSPILFKVIGNAIYLVGNEISKKMLNETFTLSASIQRDNAFRDIPLGGIKTPSNFSLKTFVRFSMRDDSLNYICLK